MKNEWEWEEVCVKEYDEGTNKMVEITERLRIPGGYLYYRKDYEKGVIFMASAMVFVPNG